MLDSHFAAEKLEAYGCIAVNGGVIMEGLILESVLLTMLVNQNDT